MTQETKPYQVFFEDQHLIVLSKSPGLLSQGDQSGEKSLVDFLREHFGRNYVGLIHRLDRNTSGLMVVAKRSKSAERLTQQLQKGELVRKYHAILDGKLDAPSRWEDWLVKNEATNEVRVSRKESPQAKVATLKVSPLFHFQDGPSGRSLTFSEFELETGRSHQIRVQAAHHGHPLIGDRKYGGPENFSLFHRPALHSSFIEFFHPMTREKMTYEQPISLDMLKSFPALLQS